MRELRDRDLAWVACYMGMEQRGLITARPEHDTISHAIALTEEGAEYAAERGIDPYHPQSAALTMCLFGRENGIDLIPRDIDADEMTRIWNEYEESTKETG